MKPDNNQKDKAISFSSAELELDIKISDVVLTPFNCASLVNEILKGVLYHKCQIPYPYTWMKNIVDKKRLKQDCEETGKPVNFTLVNHFRVVSRTYDILENLMKGISREFSNNEHSIKEVVIVLGTTPYSPKEVLSINVLPVVKTHIERNHVAELNKYQQKILRNLFLSQTWLDSIDASVKCTNTYIFLKKLNKEDSKSSENNTFIPARPLTFPSKLKHVKINLIPDHGPDLNCCDNLVVFSDTTESQVSEECDKIGNETETYMWYQSKELIQGFKDCFVNKVSASELW